MNKNEDFKSYSLEMRKFDFHGNIDDASVRNYIVNGIPGETIDKLTMYSMKTFRELEEQFEI